MGMFLDVIVVMLYSYVGLLEVVLFSRWIDKHSIKSNIGIVVFWMPQYKPVRSFSLVSVQHGERHGNTPSWSVG
ncbi:hypothetical protein CC2G_008640 [Coprinopsis cinerea AmutBmut pab1-1]|nr:hypothetical protein CC2G_008640 [Coprinopsis cinerea AmutBmut pab1-1]